MHAQPSLAPDPVIVAARAEHRAASLDELLEIGMNAARFVQRAIRDANAAADTAAAAGPEAGTADTPTTTEIATALANAFDRVARAIRQTAILAERPNTAPAPARSPATEAAAIKRRIIREVGDQIERKAIDAAEAEALHAEARERLDCEDIADDIGHRPTEEIILDVWRDLGLAYVFNNGEDGPRTVHTRSPAKIREIYAAAARTPPPPSTTDRIIHLVTPQPPPPD